MVSFQYSLFFRPSILSWYNSGRVRESLCSHSTSIGIYAKVPRSLKIFLIIIFIFQISYILWRICQIQEKWKAKEGHSENFIIKQIWRKEEKRNQADWFHVYKCHTIGQWARYVQQRRHCVSSSKLLKCSSFICNYEICMGRAHQHG